MSLNEIAVFAEEGQASKGGRGALILLATECGRLGYLSMNMPRVRNATLVSTSYVGPVHISRATQESRAPRDKKKKTCISASVLLRSPILRRRRTRRVFPYPYEKVETE